jgi:regulatory protein
MAGKTDAFQIAYAYLNRRERTVAEMRARLEKAELPQEECEQVISELLGFGYLDDARYARLFTEDKRNLEGWGSARIVRALRERGIDREVAGAALAADGGSGDSELQRAVDLLAQRFPAPPSDRRERERAYAMLMRKGYDGELAADALRAWSAGSADAL